MNQLNNRPPLPKPRSKEEWSEQWQGGRVAYELPASATRDSKFLVQVRTPKKEMERIKRVNDEFECVATSLFETGPAVTVFGSARFKARHPYYELARESCAYIVIPGGLGTLDELFEAATLVQCGKIDPFPIILMGSEFWRGMREWFQDVMKARVISREEVQFGHITDSPQEAVEFILASLQQTLRPTAAAKKPTTAKRTHS